MKRVFLLIAALAAIVVSCNKSEMIDFTNGSDTISAIIESSKTKTTIADDNSVNWSDGDVFSIITANSRIPFTLSSGAGTTAGTFTGTIPTDAVLGVVFPHNDGNSISDNTLSVTLANEYTMPESDVPMWGTYNNGTVTFKHLAGVLRFKLNDIPEGYKTLKITADKAIAGKFEAAIEDNMQLAPADGNTSADNKVITVNYTASAENDDDRVMFIPLPATTYGSLKLEISADGQNFVELLTWLNRKVECGKIYTATRTYGDISGGTPNRVEVAGSKADEISSEILDAPASSTIVITNAVNVNDGSEIKLPTPATEESNLNIQFNIAPSTSEDTPLVLSQEGNNSKDNKVKVVMPSDATGLNVNVNMPNTTTTLEGGIYSNVQSSTAENTLIVLGGTTITNLKVLKGNVRLAEGATIRSITLGNGVSITLILENGATQPTGLPGGVTVMSAAEWDLRKAAATGGTYTLTEDVTLDESLTISNDFTLNLNNKTLTLNEKIINTGNLTLNGGNITATLDEAISSTKGSLTMTDCYVDGVETLVMVTGGNAVITGGAYANESSTGNGSAYCIGILNEGTTATINTNVNVDATDNYKGGVTVQSKATATISGGNYYGNSGLAQHGLHATIGATVTYESGVTFDSFYVQGRGTTSGKALEASTVNTATFESGTNFSGNKAEMDAKIAGILGVEVDSEDDLRTAVTEGKNVKLVNDVTLSSQLDISGQTIIYLNNKTLTLNAKIVNTGNLTLKGGNITATLDEAISSTKGSLTMTDCEVDGVETLVMVTGGNAVITGGFYANESSTGNGSAYCIGILNEGTTATINTNVNVDATDNYKGGVTVQSQATATISGGKYYGNSGLAQHGLHATIGATVTYESGVTFDSFYVQGLGTTSGKALEASTVNTATFESGKNFSGNKTQMDAKIAEILASKQQ